MCTISRNSKVGHRIANIKLHPDFKKKHEEVPEHKCTNYIVPIGKVIVDGHIKKTDELFACKVCGAPMAPNGFRDHLCGPTGRVQKALYEGCSAKITLNPTGKNLGFTDGTFNAKMMMSPAGQLAV